ncbi:hypothetical protein [Bacillus sp. REN10]|uniref:hypothetical protein n=1 Tax=Bacillus sp. REN10 TaxID=2782541 RepID=UPI00193B4B8D|nr:hypothetical protein [Bacillus sp. REN10]
MKKSNYVFIAVITAIITAGCNFNSHSNSAGEIVETSQQMPDLTNGISKVQTSLNELGEAVEQSSNKVRKIQILGQQLEENWDTIEKQVEEAYPADYKNIEESLYPLINEAKKDQPNIKNIKTLLTDTKKKINTFQETVGA